mmetsp:Transcript_37674/g.61333  ORF Transcript_37674/g.61333 Transcript_37674/m.61333 type:complete len:1805 (-) Transcript_37674:866-6280(-)
MSATTTGWSAFSGQGYAKFSFKANGKYQVSLERNDQVVIDEFSTGWFKGTRLRNGEKGIFPAAFIELKRGSIKPGDINVNKHSDEEKELAIKEVETKNDRKIEKQTPAVAMNDDLLKEEVEKVLQEWSHDLTIAACGSTSRNNYFRLQEQISVLSEWRRLLWSKKADHRLPKDVKSSLRSSIVNLIEASTQLQAGYVVPRNDQGSIVHMDNASFIEMYNFHSRLQTTLDEGAQLPKSLRELDAPLCEGESAFKLRWLQRQLHREEFRRNALSRSRAKLVEAKAARGSLSIGTVPESVSSPRNWKSTFTSPFSWGAMDALPAGGSTHTPSTPPPVGREMLYKRERTASAQSIESVNEPQTVLHRDNFYDLSLQVQDVSIPSFPDTSKFYFSIYSASMHGFVTEEFLVDVSNGTISEKCMGTVFENLQGVELNSALFLVCKIVRIGTLITKSESGMKEAMYKRPFAVGVCSLTHHTTDLLCGNSTLWLHLFALNNQGKDESLGFKLQEVIQDWKKFSSEPYSLQTRLEVSASLMLHSSNTVHTTPITPKLSLGTFVNPSDVRNCLYVTLLRGTFQQDRKRSAKNIEIRTRLLSFDGEIRSSLSRGSEIAPSEFRSVVYYHDNHPRFDETINVNLPHVLSKRGCCILFMMYHASTNPSKTYPFGFAFLKITNMDGVVIPSETNTLRSFKPTKEMLNGASYLNGKLARLLYEKGENAFELRDKESLTVTTKLCSTINTQNIHINAFARSIHEDKTQDLSSILYEVRSIPASITMKMLRVILDTLFAKITMVKEDALVTELFDALTVVLAKGLNLDTSRNRAVFLQTVFTYSYEIFKNEHYCAQVFNILVKQIWLRLGAHDSLPGDHQATLTMIQSFALLLKLIILSLQQLEQASGKTVENGTVLRTQLLGIFSKINDLMDLNEDDRAIEEEEMMFLQTFQQCAIRAIGDFFEFPEEELNSLFTDEQLGQLAKDFLGSLRRDSIEIGMEKLVLVSRICKTVVIKSPAARCKVMAAYIRTVQFHIVQGDEEEKLCTECICGLLLTIQSPETKVNPRQRRDDIWNTSIVLPTIFQIALKRLLVDEASGNQEVDTITIQLVTAAFSIIHEMDNNQMTYYLATVFEAEGTTSAEGFIRTALHCVLQLITDSTGVFKLPYPAQWLLMNLLVSGCIVKLLRWFTPRLVKCFAKDAAKYDLSTGESSLWMAFLQLSLRILDFPILQLELLPSHQRKLSMDTIGDLRRDLCDLVLSCWDGPLVGNRWFFARPLAKKILHMCTSAQNERVVETARKMYFDIVCEELGIDGKLGVVEQETIDFIDEVFHSTGKHRSISMENRRRALQLFSVTLRAKDRVGVSPELSAFFDHVTKLHKLHSDLENFPHSHIYEYDRVDALIQLLEYLCKVSRRDKRFKYVETLCKIHEKLGNYAEAANSLLLLQEILEREHANGESRENLLKRAVSLLEEGRQFEHGIHTLETLRHFYEKELFDFGRVSDVLRQQALLFDEKRKAGNRYYPNYFRVTTCSNIPGNDSDQTYIYKGNDVESLADFSGRLTLRFPSLEILQGGTPLKTPEKQRAWIEVQKMTPCTSFDLAILQNTDGKSSSSLDLYSFEIVPSSVTKQNVYSGIKWFYSIKSVRKRQEKTGNEFLDNWAEKRYLKVELAFPGLSRRSRVCSELIHCVDPLRIAVQAIHEKNCDLKEKILFYTGQTTRNSDQSFTMLLSGVVDAAVNGGVLQNYNAFFSGEYQVQYPEIVANFNSREQAEKWVNELRNQLRVQLSLLKTALDIHSIVCAKDLVPLHEYLTTKYEELVVLAKHI